jgi:hypothetical protein
VSILISDNDVQQETLTDIQSFHVTAMFEIISKGYLGEKTERKDMILKGIKFEMELHVHTQDYLSLVQDVHDKAQRIKPDLTFNITAILNFPNGDTPEVLLSDVSFGEMPTDVQSRGDYVTVKLQGECEDQEIELS